MWKVSVHNKNPPEMLCIGIAETVLDRMNRKKFLPVYF